MSSFISEVISSASETEMDDLRTKMSDILQQSNKLRESVKDYMDQKYVQVYSVQESSTLTKDAAEVSSNISELQKRLETLSKQELQKLSSEMKDLVSSFKDASMAVDLIKILFDLSEHLNIMCGEKTPHYVAAQHFAACVKLLERERDNLEFTSILEAMDSKICFLFNTLSAGAKEAWKKSVCWNYCDIGNDVKVCTLSVDGTAEEIGQLLWALQSYSLSELEIYNFSQHLLTKLIIPCIDCHSTIKLSQVEGEIKCLNLNSQATIKPLFLEVLINLHQVFSFIRENMDFDIEQESPQDGGTIENVLFMTRLGDNIRDDVLVHLVENCLTHAIPTKKSKLPAYENQVQEIINFEQFLIEIGFLNSKSSTLQEYCVNVNEQFSKKTVERYLSRARDIYKKPLHDMIQVGITLGRESETSIGDSLMKVDLNEIPSFLRMDKLSPNLMQFPQCYISTSSDELVALGKEILRDMIESGEYDHQIFTTARDVFALYHEAVPMIHRKQLEMIAQQSALFYNNCWYLAHKLITINEEFRAQLSRSSRQIPPLTCFVDLAHPLMMKGSAVLDHQAIRQSNEISKLVQQSGLSSLSEYDDLPVITEKSMKQVMGILTFLQSVWQKVLPNSIYCQVMGSLSSSFLSEITNKVVTTSDIRANIATCLMKLFSSLQEQIPKLFPEPTEVVVHVKTWSRFKELVLLLGANLVSIGERWADSKGPLASVFTPTEVRQLVRALFQVSDRRAALLSRIK